MWRAAFILPQIYHSHEAAMRKSEKNLQIKGVVKLQAVWLQIYLKRTSLHVLLRSFKVLKLLKLGASIFKKHLCGTNCVQKGCSYKPLVNVSQKNSNLPRVHRAQRKIKITAN